MPLAAPAPPAAASVACAWLPALHAWHVSSNQYCPLPSWLPLQHLLSVLAVAQHCLRPLAGTGVRKGPIATPHGCLPLPRQELLVLSPRGLGDADRVGPSLCAGRSCWCSAPWP